MKFNIRTAATPARSLAAVLLGAGLTVSAVAGPVGATNAAKQEALAAWPATSEDLGKYITNVPAETTMAVVTPKGIAKTGNADEPRPGLSVMKMYIADYVLKSGDKSGRDWYLTQKMLRISDDDAANQLYKKYPEAITKTAQRYGLWSTVAGDKWGTSLTSATDAAVFLDNLRKHTPNSPVLFWMGTAAPVASDGTRQNWGTAQLPGAEGTKWGWSDYGQTAVSSASYGANYTAAAFTWGGPAKQTSDVKSARPHSW